MDWFCKLFPSLCDTNASVVKGETTSLPQKVYDEFGVEGIEILINHINTMEK
jgi:hypothetical protein